MCVYIHRSVRGRNGFVLCVYIHRSVRGSTALSCVFIFIDQLGEALLCHVVNFVLKHE